MHILTTLLAVVCGIVVTAGSTNPSCPDPCHPVLDPCSVHSGCGAFPGAECRADYCRGCIVEYFEPGTTRKVDCALPTCRNHENCRFHKCLRVNQCVADSECGYDEYCCKSCCGGKCLKRDPPPPPQGCHWQTLENCNGLPCQAFDGSQTQCKLSRSNSSYCVADHYLSGTFRKADCSMPQCPGESCEDVFCHRIDDHQCASDSECREGHTCCVGCCGSRCVPDGQPPIEPASTPAAVPTRCCPRNPPNLPGPGGASPAGPDRRCGSDADCSGGQICCLASSSGPNDGPSGGPFFSCQPKAC